MIDHVGYAVADVMQSKRFYEAALAPLGISLMVSFPDEGGAGGAYGFGTPGNPFFWIAGGGRVEKGAHVAFQARTRQQVHDFHAAALAAGGHDNGPPGPRPQYGPTYYAAFILDPDGINIEAVTHAGA